MFLLSYTLCLYTVFSYVGSGSATSLLHQHPTACMTRFVSHQSLQRHLLSQGTIFYWEYLSTLSFMSIYCCAKRMHACQEQHSALVVTAVGV